MDAYLKDSEQENLKGMLYSYLKDKAARRAGVTAKKAYEGGEEQFMNQMALHDIGSLGGALSEAAGMAGTVGGKYAKSDIVPKMNDNLYKSTQGAYENFKTLRNLEEQSNMNDLRIADYVGNLERADDANDLATRDRDFREQQYKDAAPDRALKRQMLQKQLAQRAATKRRLADDIKGPQGQPVLLDESGNPSMLEGYSYREKPLIGQSESWEIVPNAKGPNGQYLMRNKQGQVKVGNLPTGFDLGNRNDKADDKASADMAKLNETDAQKKIQIADFIDQELKVYKSQLDAGNLDQAQITGQNMVKNLNSAFGADAVGAEESARLAGALEMFKLPWKPGSMIGRDFDMFYEQAAQKSNALKQAAKNSMTRAQKIRSGEGMGVPEPTPSFKEGGSSPQGKRPDGKVRVKNKKTGQVGFVSPQFLDENKYEVMP